MPLIGYAPLPEGYVPVVDDPFGPVVSLTKDGWIEDTSGRRIFWLPEDVRVRLPKCLDRISAFPRPFRKFGVIDLSDVL